MQPLFIGWNRQIVVFRELQAKHPSGFNKIYTQYLNGYDKSTLQNLIFSWRVPPEKMKIKVSRV